MYIVDALQAWVHKQNTFYKRAIHGLHKYKKALKFLEKNKVRKLDHI